MSTSSVAKLIKPAKLVRQRQLRVTRDRHGDIKPKRAPTRFRNILTVIFDGVLDPIWPPTSHRRYCEAKYTSARMRYL